MTLLTPDIEFCACAIYADLSQHVKECSLSAFFDLCEKHEKPILFDRSIPPRQGGMCIESNIILSPGVRFASTPNSSPMSWYTLSRTRRAGTGSTPTFKAGAIVAISSSKPSPAALERCLWLTTQFAKSLAKEEYQNEAFAPVGRYALCSLVTLRAALVCWSAQIFLRCQSPQLPHQAGNARPIAHALPCRSHEIKQLLHQRQPQPLYREEGL